MASMKSRFRPAHDAKLHMLAGPLGSIQIIKPESTQNQDAILILDEFNEQ